MIEEQAHFYSDGLRLDGRFYFPDDRDQHPPRALVVPCAGFMELRKVHPERFARSLTQHGYGCYAFDYRGFGPSSGPEGRVVLEEQVRDIRHAATFASDHEDLAELPVILLGWGMAAGLVLQAASGVPNLRGLVCINGFYDGRRMQRRVRGEEDFERFEQWVVDERRASVRSPQRRTVDPFDIYPLDPVTREYVDEVLRKQPGFGGKVDTALADSLLTFKPERQLDDLREVPVLIAHSDRNELHPAEEAESLYGRYPGEKELYWIRGGGHTEWMRDESPLYAALADRIVYWLDAIV